LLPSRMIKQIYIWRILVRPCALSFYTYRSLPIGRRSRETRMGIVRRSLRRRWQRAHNFIKDVDGEAPARGEPASMSSEHTELLHKFMGKWHDSRKVVYNSG
jgi:hypothetical protein